ncbi:MAG: WXG100 family type VII secretion target [Lachnospiraceae bacterium]|nr:WXG100 family type VII secretion target [Lachnospiraceae bacterium]MBQ8666662.1 WXG100 family type VII secretion target [Lachnospiraceae bacterium]
MNTMLKVTPEKLIEAAGDFQNTEANVRSLTEEMISIVDSLKPVWQGEAATGFANRFAALSDDMNKLYALIRKHADSLTDIANEYRQAEADSGNIAADLAGEALI